MSRHRRSVPSLEEARADYLNKMVTRPSHAAPAVTSSHKPLNEMLTTHIFSIPDKQARGQALSLLTRLQRNPFIAWDDLGNVHLYGTYLPRANIADLILYAVYRKDLRDARKKATKPPHWNEFEALVQRMSQKGAGYKHRRCPVHHRA